MAAKKNSPSKGSRRVGDEKPKRPRKSRRPTGKSSADEPLTDDMEPNGRLSSDELRARRVGRVPRRVARLEVEVRMYSPGLGDCFLLTFREGNGEDLSLCHVLIDCGVFVGTKGGAARIRKISEDITQVTKGHLQVLALTHEHWDHLSGFVYADEIFTTKLDSIDHVWLAWTEDPGDPLANRLRQRRHNAAMALRALSLKMEKKGEQLRHLLQFMGLDGEGTDPDVSESKQLRNSAEVLEWASNRRNKSDDFLRPGRRPLRLPGIQGVRIYVLGPPENRDLLEKSNPSAHDPETYHLSLETAFYEAAFAAGLAARPEATPDLKERAMPFPVAMRRPLDSLAKVTDLEVSAVYSHDAQRSIDTDWLDTADRLALKLDNDTNNTSLVLAFELIESGKVLLFPGDAQVGNWLSWHDLTWDTESAVGRRTVTAEDLLQRTVLYKVGHHASHNATLQDKGLELMNSSELVAMIPVDHEFAHGRFGWNMPFASLLRRLQEKTRGRVIRSDSGVPKERPQHINDSDWQAFLDRLDYGPDGDEELWISYTIEGEAD